jgi:hypothetical protein
MTTKNVGNPKNASALMIAVVVSMVVSPTMAQQGSPIAIEIPEASAEDIENEPFVMKWDHMELGIQIASDGTPHILVGEDELTTEDFAVLFQPRNEEDLRGVWSAAGMGALDAPVGDMTQWAVEAYRALYLREEALRLGLRLNSRGEPYLQGSEMAYVFDDVFELRTLGQTGRIGKIYRMVFPDRPFDSSAATRWVDEVLYMMAALRVAQGVEIGSISPRSERFHWGASPSTEPTRPPSLPVALVNSRGVAYISSPGASTVYVADDLREMLRTGALHGLRQVAGARYSVSDADIRDWGYKVLEQMQVAEAEWIRMREEYGGQGFFVATGEGLVFRRSHDRAEFPVNAQDEAQFVGAAPTSPVQQVGVGTGKAQRLREPPYSAFPEDTVRYGNWTASDRKEFTYSPDRSAEHILVHAFSFVPAEILYWGEERRPYFRAGTMMVFEEDLQWLLTLPEPGYALLSAYTETYGVSSAESESELVMAWGRRMLDEFQQL